MEKQMHEGKGKQKGTQERKYERERREEDDRRDAFAGVVVGLTCERERV